MSAAQFAFPAAAVGVLFSSLSTLDSRFSTGSQSLLTPAPQELPEPQGLASEAITELEAVVNDLRDIVELPEKEEGVEK